MKHRPTRLSSAHVQLSCIVLALALLSARFCPVHSTPQRLPSRDYTDLAFVAPAGGSSLSVGQEFQLAMQLTAAIPTVSFIWTDSPTSSSRSVLYNALLQPNQTTTVVSSFPGCGAILLVAGALQEGDVGECYDEGRGGWESCAAHAVVHDELYLNFVCDGHATCNQGACHPSPATRLLPPPFDYCNPLAGPPTTDAWEGWQLKDVLQQHARRQLAMVAACTSGSCSSPDVGAVLHLGHSGGIGNKLVAVATALLIALLSNRTVVSLLPQDICGALDVGAVRSFVAIACSPSQAAEYLGTSIHSITEEGAVAAGWPLFFAGFLDAQYSTVLSCCSLPLGRLAAASTRSSSSSAAAAAVWVYSGNQYLVPLLQANAHYRPLLLRLFGSNVDKWLMAAILRPSAAAAVLASQFLKHHSFSSVSVSYQARQFPSCSGSRRTDVRGVRQFGCGLTMCEAELKSAATAAVEAAQMIAADGRERVLVYVASDEVDEAMGYMSSAITDSVGGDSRLSVLNSEHVREFFESHGGDTSLLPMVDIIIMSQSTVLITSPGSTFGYAAAAAAAAAGNATTVTTVQPGGSMVTLRGANVFSHSKLSLVQAACYNGDDMWSTSEDQICNACPYPLCACNNEGVMCSSPSTAAVARYMLPQEAVDRIKRLHPDWRLL